VVQRQPNLPLIALAIGPSENWNWPPPQEWEEKEIKAPLKGKVTNFRENANSERNKFAITM